MVYTEKTKQGFIYAYAEWWIVNKDGQIDRNGEYVFINDLWIHEDYRYKGVMRRFIHKGAKEYPQLKYLYYRRGKYSDRLTLYSRKQLKEEI